MEAMTLEESNTRPAWAVLLRLELIFTVLPALLLPALILVLKSISPGIMVGVILLGMGYLLPASLVVNSLGYKTINGDTPLPGPDMSLTTLMILVVTHAVLVAAFFLICRSLGSWIDRERARSI